MLELYQLKKAYRYNSDSLALARFCQPKKGQKILDIGCGCGVIGLILKSLNPSIELSLVDIQETNIRLATKNLKHNKLKARLIRADFLKLENDEKYDILVCNPPFYSSFSQNLHKNISKNKENLPLKELLKKARSILSPKGELYFCYEAASIDKLFIALNEAKLKAIRLCFICDACQNAAKLALIQAKKSSKSPCEVTFKTYENTNEFELKSLDFKELD